MRSYRGIIRHIGVITILFLWLTSAAISQEATEDPLPFNTSPAPIGGQPEPEEADPDEEDQIEAEDTEEEETPAPEVEPIIITPGQASPTPTPQPLTSGTMYTVQRGDTLFRIAQRFGTTTNTLAAANGIANPSLIFVGQQLLIPGSGDLPPVEAPTQIPLPAEGDMYTVQRGDNLYRISIRNNTTIAILLNLNSQITNPNIIFVGQQIRLPGSTEQVPAPLTPTTPSTDETTETPTDTTPDETQAEPTDEGTDETTVDEPSTEISMGRTYGYGIEVFFSDVESVRPLIEQVNTLGMDWVKVRVDWRELEAEEGQVDYALMDVVVRELAENDLMILLTITNAPAWARTSVDENGPPDDLNNYTTFVNALAERYRGVVTAYEIWDEPNLRRNWNCNRQMCDTDYAEMLRLAYNAVKIANPEAIVVSAGLAPTRFNDRINAVDDRLYLQTLYAQGLAEFSDAIGVHPGGWANPPDSFCCEQPIGVETHYESDSFYFINNLNTYEQIMRENGDADTPLWITKFGWGTSEDTDPPGQLNVFVSYTSLAEQAIYVSRAFEVATAYPLVSAMFLDNLNGCETGRNEACYNSLISPSGEPRTAFDAVRMVDKNP